MRAMPHKLLLMSLQGRKSVSGWPLSAPEDALARLKMMSGQNFCADAEKWRLWLRFRWNECYGVERDRSPVFPAIINPGWITSNVKALAQSIHDDRRFTDMPILADALEEAGCDNADILNHCRQAGEHLRGCWVLDALLGKA
jgi:hypothetical protein